MNVKILGPIEGPNINFYDIGATMYNYTVTEKMVLKKRS